MIYNSGRYCGIVSALTNSPYNQEFRESIAIPGKQLGLVTEDYLNFIATEDGGILTTEG